MQRFLNLCAAHPWWVLSLLLLFTLLAGRQLPNVEVQISAEELLVMDDPERAYYSEISRRFGDEKVVLLFLEDENLLGLKKLKVLKQVISELEKQSFVERVESLFSIPHLKSKYGYLDKEPYLATLPASPEAAAKLLKEAQQDPFIKQVLLSSDNRVMAVAIILRKGVGGSDDLTVTATIDQVTQPLASLYEEVFNIGYPFVRSAISEQIQEEQGKLFPLAIGTLLIALFLLLRQLVDVLTPVLTAGVSIIWMLGLMGITGIPLNVITSIVPVLLIVVGSTEDIHLLSEFRQGQRRGLETQAALSHMSLKMGRTVLLTFITTYMGFLSVGISKIEVLWQFAILASTGLLFNFVVTISLIPALLSITGKWQLDGKSRLVRNSGSTLADRYWQWLHSNRWGTLAVLGVCTLVAALGIPGIQVNHSTTDSLGQGSEVQRQVASVNSQLAGLETFSIIVDSGIQDTFLKVRYLEEIVEIEKFITSQGFARSTTSFTNYLSMLNRAFQELPLPQLPLSDDEINELMIFLDYSHVKAYVSEDYSSARILVRHDISSTRELQHFVDSLNLFFAQNLDPGLEAHITGSSVLTLSATDAMIEGQLHSITLLLLVFILIISILFTDLRVGLLAALPNAFPVVVLFGVMGYGEIPLNIGTAMAAAIAIGIAVDDTMHFMLRYNQELKTTKSQSRAMLTTIQNEARPVFATSIALIAGFLTFTLSDFQPIAQFGMLSALVIASALIADFVITPLAISTLRLVSLWDMLSSHLRQQVIPKSVLFKGMKPWQIRRFILSSTVLDFSAGRAVFCRGDESNELYLVMSGAVEVVVPGGRGGTEDLVVDQFGAGEVFGDVAVLVNQSRLTNAIAMVPTSLLVVHRDALQNTTFLHPIIAGRLFLNLATDVSRRWVVFVERLRQDELQEKRPSGKDNE
ncbi:MAG: MMPL family transporter [Candidatus Sedimenticola sp. (ex Thyasira tokunagai)]